jgi:hypothetical protein
MPRKKLPAPSPTFQPERFRLKRAVKRTLRSEYLVPDPRDPARVSQLAEVINRYGERKIRPTLDAVQSWAIKKIEASISEYLGAVKSGNGSLSERDKPGAPKKSARNRMIGSLMNVLWPFYHGVLRGRSVTKSEWKRDRYAYLRLIFSDPRIKINAPKSREGHTDSELREWIETVPHKWVSARNGTRRDIWAKADIKARHRKEPALWEMPPRIRSIKRDDETIETIDDDAEA